MTDPNAPYVLGTDDAELARLRFQHRLWAGSASECWERAKFLRGHRLLDVGSGPGFTTMDLAELVGSAGHVVGVDQSEPYLAHLEQQSAARTMANVTAQRADVQSMDLPPASFDGAYSRWVLCFVKRPENVVRAVAQSLRPGARFAVQDYSHYLGVGFLPGHRVFDRVFEAVAESFRSRGGDPNVGTQLPELFAAHGLRIEYVRPIQRSARPADPLWQWPVVFFDTYLDKLAEQEFIGEADKTEFASELRARTQNPDSVFLTPPMIEIIGVKE